MPNWNRLFRRRASPPSASSPPSLPVPVSPPTEPASPDPAPEAVSAAVQAFVSASSWPDTRAVLEREQRLLLTDAALDVLQASMQQARDAGDERAAQVFMAHAALLALARKNGIAAAWEEVARALSQPDEQHDDDAPTDPFETLVLAWLNTHGRRQQRHFLGEHPELAQERALDILADLIAQYADQPDAQQELRLARAVIRSAQQRGVTPTTLDDAFVNAYGGFVLSLPAWLEHVIAQDDDIQQRGRPDETASARITLWRDALTRAQAERVAPPIVAEIAANLSNRWNDLHTADQARVIEARIQALLLSAQTYKQAAFPYQWAMTQNNLGNAYRERIAGERADNLERALASYTAALQVYTRDAFPTDCEQTLLNAAAALAEARRWSAMQDHLREALTIEDLRFAEASDLHSQEAVLADGRDVALQLAAVAARLGDLAGALVTVEAGRACSLAQARQLAFADPARIGDPDRRALSSRA